MLNLKKTKAAYAGIGSRKTPPSVLANMQSIGQAFARLSWTLRTGNARGADQAFQQGANSIDPNLVELFLPWPGYQAEQIQPGNAMHLPSSQAYDIAAKYHPAWHRCSRQAKAMHARNVAIVLGDKLEEPVSCLVCWTPGGRLVGGTAQGIRIARTYGVTVYNLAKPDGQGFAAWLLGRSLDRQLCFQF